VLFRQITTMTAIEEARSVTAKLSPADRRSLFEWLATEPMELAAGIYCTPGVSGGDACVGRTRIAVWVLEAYRRSGMSDRDLLGAYPMLTPQDLTQAWAYADSHAEELGRLIRENESGEET
jgi:uncharacterized protein (DUF433 family)